MYFQSYQRNYLPLFLSPRPIAHLLAKRIVQEDEALLSGVICGSGTLPKHPCFRSTVKEHRFNYLYLIFWWAILCTLLYLLIDKNTWSSFVWVQWPPQGPQGAPSLQADPLTGPSQQAVIGQIRKQTACGLSLRTLPPSSPWFLLPDLLTPPLQGLPCAPWPSPWAGL